MIIIPLVTTPNQRLAARLNGQDATIKLAQKRDILYFSLSVSSRDIVTGVAVFNRVKLVRHRYLDFVGDLAVVDMQGNSDPSWDGLGGADARYQLVYLAPEDL